MLVAHLGRFLTYVSSPVLDLCRVKEGREERKVETKRAAEAGRKVRVKKAYEEGGEGREKTR